MDNTDNNLISDKSVIAHGFIGVFPGEEKANIEESINSLLREEQKLTVFRRGLFAFCLCCVFVMLLFPFLLIEKSPLVNLASKVSLIGRNDTRVVGSWLEDDTLHVILTDAYVNVHDSYLMEEDGSKYYALSFNAPEREIIFDAPVGSVWFYICDQSGTYTRIFFDPASSEGRGTVSSNFRNNTSDTKGSRDCEPQVLIPQMSGETVYSSDDVIIDASNASQGYIFVRYAGSNEKVKLQITGSDDVTYTYNLATGGGKDEVFPLSAGDGLYLVNVYENISGNQYATAFSASFDVKLENEFLPYLYPNQYVWFNAGNLGIAKGKELAWSANNDLDVISNVYNYIISNITYDYEEAETVESGYIPDIDEVMETGKGICLDYACLMASILRSQRIPTHMEVGYAGTAYHAWISCYISDKGWVNGIVQFDGTTWQLMDPTFGSTTPEEKLRSFIGDSSNYSVKYIY
ncbi:transglutaminase-like domain-containing protein [Butyrivibrio sp. MC2013]|uniref:transglutaminase-like domain-containing protein n=1 Tax=Butyrivibrio sp. MC2013 TaxID=1280686 RepID=UPI000417B9D1|nr:transglutaminase-like domain-containing protein [Butyrivibrio sp. MC2013]